MDERVGFGVLYRRGLVLTAVERDTIRVVTPALEPWYFPAAELRCRWVVFFNHARSYLSMMPMFGMLCSEIDPINQ